LDDKVTLPGSMAENGKGNEVTLKTDWTGDIVDKSNFTDMKYEKYRQPWNTAWTGNQPPHTLGILCDPKTDVDINKIRGRVE
jgi:hypothetical protein